MLEAALEEVYQAVWVATLVLVSSTIEAQKAELSPSTHSEVNQVHLPVTAILGLVLREVATIILQLLVNMDLVRIALARIFLARIVMVRMILVRMDSVGVRHFHKIQL